MRYEPIPDGDTVVRYVPWAKLRKDENDNVVGVLGEAFNIRDTDDGKLSTTWCEYFSGSIEESVRCASIAAENGGIGVRPKSAFALAQVGQIKKALDECDRKVRILHDPVAGNPAHCVVTVWRKDDTALFDFLASETWANYLPTVQIRAYNATDCQPRQ